MEGDSSQLVNLRNILQIFSAYTGLKVNYSKSMLVPINLEESESVNLAQSFGCSTGSLPFTYLGLPLGLSKPKLADFLPMVNKCEKRLSCTIAFLSQAGRLEVTNSIFTALPMYYTCTFKLHKAVIKQVDKYRKHCLWRGDINAKSPPKSAWELVCLPKVEGGLGVLNLRTQNKVLLLKYLHKFFNRADIPWVHLIWEKYYSNGTPPSTQKKRSFWWRDILKLLDAYKGMVMVNVKDGSTCKLWDDLWLHRVPQLHFPELFSLTKLPDILLKAALSLKGPSQIFFSRKTQENYTSLY